jgi:hypothetical protein
MPNKIKLNLEDLKVESFVTELNNAEKDNLRGGTHIKCGSYQCTVDCTGPEECGTVTGSPRCIAC